MDFTLYILENQTESQQIQHFEFYCSNTSGMATCAYLSEWWVHQQRWQIGVALISLFDAVKESSTDDAATLQVLTADHNRATQFARHCHDIV